eukprot:m.94916 g.94916  ORF g.94916 m.94916 type:complete len:415 (+) comp15432_c0_seq2:430-1674(+)
MSDDEGADEPLDPRIETALLTLNSASEEINDNERKYEATKKQFSEEMDRMKGDIRVLTRKIGPKILAQARPYYDLAFQAYLAQADVKRASEYYEAAFEFLKSAKMAVREIEKQLETGAKFDEAMQHQLNTAYEATTSGEAKLAKIDQFHVQKMKAFREKSEQVKVLFKSKKKAITKSRLYFQRKLEHDKALQVLRDRLLFLARGSVVARNNYSSALKTLEKISAEIHNKRMAAKAQGEAAEAAAANLLSPVAEAKLKESVAAADAALQAIQSTDREAEAQNMVSQLSSIDESAGDDDATDTEFEHCSDDESLNSEAELTNFMAEYAHMRSKSEGTSLTTLPEFDELAALPSPSVRSPVSATAAGPSASGALSPTSPQIRSPTSPLSPPFMTPMSSTSVASSGKASPTKPGANGK